MLDGGATTACVPYESLFNEGTIQDARQSVDTAAGEKSTVSLKIGNVPFYPVGLPPYTLIGAMLLVGCKFIIHAECRFNLKGCIIKKFNQKYSVYHKDKKTKVKSFVCRGALQSNFLFMLNMKPTLISPSSYTSTINVATVAAKQQAVTNWPRF